MRIPEWTPPIFGWQYKLHWIRSGADVTVSSWDWKYWPVGSKYFVWVAGSAHGTNHIHWSVFFTVTHQSIGVRFVEQSHNLTKAIRNIERQAHALEAAIMELRAHEGKRLKD